MNGPLVPLVTCPKDKVGDTADPRWNMIAAVCSRTRTDRVAAARRALRSRSPLISKEQRGLMHAIVAGPGDLIGIKTGEVCTRST